MRGRVNRQVVMAVVLGMAFVAVAVWRVAPFVVKKDPKPAGEVAEASQDMPVPKVSPAPTGEIVLPLVAYSGKSPFGEVESSGFPPVSEGDIDAVRRALEGASHSGGLEFVGTMEGSDGFSAFLRLHGETEVVTAGETAFGYRVKGVSSDKVTLAPVKGKGKDIVLKMEANE